jgi:hypothetical protein
MAVLLFSSYLKDAAPFAPSYLSGIKSAALQNWHRSRALATSDVSGLACRDALHPTLKMKKIPWLTQPHRRGMLTPSVSSSWIRLRVLEALRLPG